MIYDSHESWLNNTDTPVLHLDGSKDFKHDEDVDDFLDSIDEFLRSK